MEVEAKQFSENLWYEKENNNVRVFTIDKEDLCTFILEFDEDKLVMKYDIVNFNDKFIESLLVWEMVMSLINSALINGCGCLELKSIPMDINLFAKLVNATYINSFGERFKTKKIAQNPLIDVEFEIIQQRNTHYIQQAYLRKFSSNRSECEITGDKNKARIFMFNKKLGNLETLGKTPIEKKYGPKISSIAKEEYFHSLLFEVTIANTLEKNTPPITDEIIKTKSISKLSERDKEELIKYIIFTWQRPKEARLNIKEVMEKAYLLEAKRFFKDEIPPNVRVEYNEISLRIQHEQNILAFIAPKSPHYLVEHFMDFDFRLIKARLPDFFLTSDNPVIRNNSYYFREKRAGNDYIKKRIEELKKNILRDTMHLGYIEITSEHPERAPGMKGVEFYLPISPSLCLCMFDKLNGIKPLSVHNIHKEIILQSNLYIYSHTSNLEFINKIIKKNPECIEKKGKRSIIIGDSREIPKKLRDKIRYKNLSKDTYKKILDFD